MTSSSSSRFKLIVLSRATDWRLAPLNLIASCSTKADFKFRKPPEAVRHLSKAIQIDRQSVMSFPPPPPPQRLLVRRYRPTCLPLFYLAFYHWRSLARRQLAFASDTAPPHQVLSLGAPKRADMRPTRAYRAVSGALCVGRSSSQLREPQTDRSDGKCHSPASVSLASDVRLATFAPPPVGMIWAPSNKRQLLPFMGPHHATKRHRYSIVNSR